MSDLLSMKARLQKPASTKPITSADIRACIQNHFGTGGERYAVLYEVRNGTAGRANRSVDAVVMSLWPSLGMELWGMEIKVSRGDWLNELKKPSKASEMFDNFDRWFLVSPFHVAAMGEIPPNWGWFVPDRGKLRMAREAPKHKKPKPIDRHFLAALMRRTAKTDDGFIDKIVQQELEAQRERQDADIERRALQKIGDLKGDAESWRKLKAVIKGESKDSLYDEEIIAAVRILIKSGVASTYSSVLSLIITVDGAKKSLDKIRDDLGIEKPK